MGPRLSWRWSVLLTLEKLMYQVRRGLRSPPFLRPASLRAGRPFIVRDTRQPSELQRCKRKSDPGLLRLLQSFHQPDVWFRAQAANRGGFSYDHERDSHSQNDQCIYASDHDAKVNAGHHPLKLGLGFPVGHPASPSAYLKQKTDIRSEQIFESIPRYLVPKPLPR